MEQYYYTALLNFTFLYKVLSIYFSCLNYKEIKKERFTIYLLNISIRYIY
ncbi:hypothetical protein FACS189483_10410 [Spirochaetia bacterium]|nr:hypothetical protein FACS189483_10410 [Spirochaetia bacterium]